ncbi:MAG: sulfatase-like hydrolase/transferase [Chitinophagales bacterium]|nr:sulfatase-like hydrolase/transferase [Chitinophagales bacterium]
MKQILTFFLLLPVLTSGQINPTARPNIILIIGDDLRYDSYDVSGGPNWFNTPAINRIAEEGAYFKNFFSVYAVCVPSRSSIMTGLYPHNNGAYDNFEGYDLDLPTIGTILNSAGYHTAMIGKYDVYENPQPGWDYWMAKKGKTEYENAEWNVNGTDKLIPGHVTQIINDSSNKMVAKLDTPFMICIEHQTPHQPVIPLPQDVGKYADEPMPIPSNFVAFNYLYPSFLYQRPFYTEVDALAEDMQAYFEGIQGIEDNVDQIFKILTLRNLLQNTLIMYTGDNGIIQGEHLLRGKGLPYEPSMRVPMFIRYPEWFTPNTVSKKQIGLNIDIAPTLLEAAGIKAAPYKFPGYSLHQLELGNVKRDMFLFENIKIFHPNDDESFTPSSRTIRTKSYKYNWYQCIEQTEEFFNLDKDPEENFNLIHDPTYAVKIEQYRHLLDSMRIALHDTVSADTFKKPCKLISDPRPYELAYIVQKSGMTLNISPSPFSDNIIVKILTENQSDVEVMLYNLLGQLLVKKVAHKESGYYDTTINGNNLPPGIYLVRVTQNGDMSSQYIFKN